MSTKKKPAQKPVSKTPVPTLTDTAIDLVARLQAAIKAKDGKLVASAGEAIRAHLDKMDKAIAAGNEEAQKTRIAASELYQKAEDMEGDTARLRKSRNALNLTCRNLCDLGAISGENPHV